MPTLERDVLGDNDPHHRNKHSFSSDCGRAIVPMWDSSDPERAPPPLPMNPSSPSLASRSNASSNIQSAHAALTDKAWESGYTTNPPPKRIENSPERFMLKGVAHKRIKSLQPGVRDLSNLLESGASLSISRSPEKSPGRLGNTYTFKEMFSDTKSHEKEPRNVNEGKSPERDSRFLRDGKSLYTTQIPGEKYPEIGKETKKDNRHEEDSNRSKTPSPVHQDSQNKDILKVRSSSRRPTQSILGENTPPQSATMLALHSMANKDQNTTLSNITNSSSTLNRTPQTFDAISNQILSLTSIATNLQKEMSQLSRRSKDNATDLVSLKEATNARDEDIRKSLRELVHNLNEAGSRTSSNSQGSGGLFFDNNSHNSPVSKGLKAFSLPRIPSPTSFANSLDRESIVSPASYLADGVAIIALLEKVIREMGTREGQEHLISQISECLTRNESSISKKIDDLTTLIKINSSDPDLTSKYGGNSRVNRSRAHSIDLAPRLELDFDNSQTTNFASHTGAITPSTSKQGFIHETERVQEIINEDTMRIIRTIKDSVTQGGGLTAEVKALVRELRGEVLGMGREIGRKLDEVNEESAKVVASEKELVSRLVKNGIEDLKTHLDQILREHRRQSIASLASKTLVDYQEICKSVRGAMIELDQSRRQGLEKEDILNAIKDAWESYKPEIEVQQLGFERDDLLTCLKEGIQTYIPQNYTPSVSGATREEVYDAVVEGLKHFSLPSVETDASLSREKILSAVRECLGEFQFPLTSQTRSIEKVITRDDMLDTLKEGLRSFDFDSIKTSIDLTNRGLTRTDIVEALKDGIKDLRSTGGSNELTREVVLRDTRRENLIEDTKPIFSEITEMDTPIGKFWDKLQEFLEPVRTELETISIEAKHNISSTNLATEQLLDTTRDGFERLHTEIEGFVDKTSAHEIKDTMYDMRGSIAYLRADMEWLISNITAGSANLVLAEIENLREILSTTIIPSTEAEHLKFFTTLQDGLDSIKEMMSSSLVPKSPGPMKAEVLDAIRDGLEIYKETISSSLVLPSSGPSNAEVLDSIEGILENIKETISSALVPSSSGQIQEVLTAIKDGVENIKETLSYSLVPPSTGPIKTEVLDVIRGELEGYKETMSSSLVLASTGNIKDEVLITIQDSLQNIKETFSGSLVPKISGPIKAEVLEAIRNGLEGYNEKISSSLVPANSEYIQDEVLNSIKDGIDNIKDILSNSLVATRAEPFKTEILDSIRDGIESCKETVWSSNVPTSSENGKDEVLITIQDDLQTIKETFSSSLVQTSSGQIKEGITSAFKDSIDNLKESLSNSLAPKISGLNRAEIIDAIKEGLEKFEEKVSTTLVPGGSVLVKDEILSTIKDGFQDIKETISTSIAPVTSGPTKGEIIDLVKDGLEEFKQIMSSSLVPGSSEPINDEILTSIKHNLEKIRESISTTIALPMSESYKNDNADATKEESSRSKETTLTSNVPGVSDSEMDETLASIKDSLESLKEKLTPGLNSDSTDADKVEIFDMLKDGLESIKEMILISKSPETNMENVEALGPIKDGIESIKDLLATFPVPESFEQDKDEVLDVIRDGLDNIKETISSSSLGLGDDKIEILMALKDGLENVKETILITKGSETNVEKLEIIDTIKDGFENFKETMSTSLVSNSTMNGKDEILSAIREGLDNIKETMSTSLVPSISESSQTETLESIKNSLENINKKMSTSLVPTYPGLHKNESLDIIKDGFKDFKDILSKSDVPESVQLQKQILDEIKHGFEKFEVTTSSSLVPVGSDLRENENLGSLKDVLENIKETILTSLVPVSSGPNKDEILDAIKVGLGNLREVESVGLVPGNSTLGMNEILCEVKDGLENIKDMMLTSLMPTISGTSKVEVLDSIKDGLENIKEIMSTSHISTSSRPSKNEILDIVKDELEDFKEKLSASLIPGNPMSSTEDVLNTVRKGLDNIKDSLSTSVVSARLGPSNYEVLEAINGGFEKINETISTSIVTSMTEHREDEALKSMKDILENIKEILLTSNVPSNPRASKDEITDAIKHLLENFQSTNSISPILGSYPVTNEGLNSVKEGVEGVIETISKFIVSRDLDSEMDETLASIKDSLESLKEKLTPGLNSDSTDADKVEIFDMLKDGLESIKEMILISKSPETNMENVEALGPIKDGIESIKDLLATFPVPESFEQDKDEVLDVIRDGLDNIKETISSSSLGLGDDKIEILMALKDGLENVKETILITKGSETNVEKLEIIDTIKDGFENFKETMSTSLVSNSTMNGKDEILSAIREGLDSIKETMSTSLISTSLGPTKDEISGIIKDELNDFKETISSSLIPGNSVSNTEDVLNKVREGLNNIKDSISTSVVSAGLGPSNFEVLEAINGGFEKINETMSTSLVSATSGKESDEILVTIQEGLESFKESYSNSLISENKSPDMNEVLGTIKFGLENFKDTILSSLVLENSGPTKNEVLDIIKDEVESFKETISVSLVPRSIENNIDKILQTVKVSLDEFKSLVMSRFPQSDIGITLQELERGLQDVKKEVNSYQDNPDNHGKSQILDVIQVGFSKVQTEIENMSSRSVNDSIVTGLKHDILNTLQTELESIHTGINELKNDYPNDKENFQNENTAIVPFHSKRPNIFESLECRLADLSNKVDNLVEISAKETRLNLETLSKNDLTEIEDLVKKVHNCVVHLTDRDRESNEDDIRREDLGALETLLRNTKAKIDDLCSEQPTTKEDISSLELLNGDIRDSITNLTTHLEDVSKQDDIGNITSIIKEVLTTTETLKYLMTKDLESSDKITKVDIYAVESVCSEIKSTLDHIFTSEMASLASKENIENLEALIKESKDQIDKHASNFSELSGKHSLETIGIGKTIGDFMQLLRDFEKNVQEKLAEGNSNVDALRNSFEGFGDVLTQNSAISGEVKALSDTVRNEFEKSTAAVVGSKLELDEKFQQTWDKLDFNFDKKLNDLSSKYDDARIVAEAAIKSSEVKANEIEKVLNVTRTTTQTATDDIKLLANHLNNCLDESLENVQSKSDKLITHLDETKIRLEKMHAFTETGHQKTHDEIAKILSLVEGVDKNLKEYIPRTTESIRDLCLTSNRQYENSKTSVMTFQDTISEKQPTLESQALLLSPKLTNEYDEIKVHQKLDKLVEGMNFASKSFAQLDILDEIHQQVIKTAAQVSEYFTAQNKRMNDENANKKREAEEIENMLERRLVQKNHVEASVLSLREEEKNLKKSISDLKIENDSLAIQKVRLYADVSGLETALNIRREELEIMEKRAASLERRILEGVVDHSRALLISKANKGREAMSRKRVSSNNSSIIEHSTPQDLNMTELTASMVKNGNRSATNNPSASSSRRILSLSQISNNASPSNSNINHVIRAPSGTIRKSSWGGTFGMDYNKENLPFKDNSDFCVNESGSSIDKDIYSDNTATHNSSTRNSINESGIYSRPAGSIESDELDIEVCSEAETTVTAEIENDVHREVESGDTFVVLFND